MQQTLGRALRLKTPGEGGKVRARDASPLIRGWGTRWRAQILHLTRSSGTVWVTVLACFSAPPPPARAFEV